MILVKEIEDNNTVINNVACTFEKATGTKDIKMWSQKSNKYL